MIKPRVGSKDRISDPFKLNEAIEVLQKFSLLRRDPETKVLSMHRLVQAVLEEGKLPTLRIWEKVFFPEEALIARNCPLREPFSHFLNGISHL